ncbi:zinc ribbon domain-containing protein [Desulfamplus magnetovallimortis]|uniref:zinc ribbon domain-containing protein n=1 Tax=Desulfamplus magnetovallimortis TaxID=1246637 RepID=UPI0009B9A63F|nr:zinc ribbon domain-containing protein [Desulfamplus magnetovallimortis]
MPIFDFHCNDCGRVSEILMVGNSEKAECSFCGSSSMTQKLSAHSSLSGPAKHRLPGSGDRACCGSAPGEKSGCAGPGSCCGKSM